MRCTSHLSHVVQVDEDGGMALEAIVLGQLCRECVLVRQEVLGCLVVGHLRRLEAVLAGRRHAARGAPSRNAACRRPHSDEWKA